MLVGHRALLAAFLRTPRFAPIEMPSKRKASTSPSLPPSTAVNGDNTTAASVIVAADHLEEPQLAVAPPPPPPPPPKAKRVSNPKPKAPKVPPPPPGPVYDPETMRPPKLDSSTQKTFQVLSWNVAGLRALFKKNPGTLKSLIDAESPVDCLMLQEHKLQNGQHCIDAAATLAESFPEWTVHWNCSTDKKGYSGTAVLSRTPPLSVFSGIGDKEHDGEGRVLTAEFEKMFVVNVYVPNSGEGLKRLDYRVKEWDVKFSKYLKALEQRGKPVVLTGDLNCAAQEIDIHSPKTNLRSAGFTQEERDSFAQRFLNNGFIDCFRKQHPDVVGYTYWGYRFNLRAKNKGWRLDYFLVSEELADDVYDCFHLPQILGSDHCPLGIIVKI